MRPTKVYGLILLDCSCTLAASWLLPTLLLPFRLSFSPLRSSAHLTGFCARSITPGSKAAPAKTPRAPPPAPRRGQRRRPVYQRRCTPSEALERRTLAPSRTRPRGRLAPLAHPPRGSSAEKAQGGGGGGILMSHLLFA